MNRTEFMKKLELLLADISENERQEAINFYEDYFDDAGAENEQEVIESLGSPEKVAQIIKEGLEDGSAEKGAFTEKGFEDPALEKKDEITGYGSSKKKSVFEKIKNMGVSGWILLLIVVIFAWPFIGSAVIVAATVIFAIFAAAVVLIFGLAIAGIVAIATGGILLASTIGALIVSPQHVMILAGMSLVLIGIGVLLLVCGIWVITKAAPPLIRRFTEYVGKIFRKEGATG